MVPLSFLPLLGLSVIASQPISRPALPENFKASMVLSLPYINLDMLIDVSQEKAKGYQVVDFYNGLHSQYYSVPDNKLMFHVYNMTERICIDSEEAGEGPPELVNIFPDLSTFKYAGLQNVRGMQCDKWTNEIDRPGEYEEFFWDPRLNLPVRWLMHSREPIFDSHLDDYIVDYISLKPLSSSAPSQPEWFRWPKECEAPRSKFNSGGPHLSKARGSSAADLFKNIGASRSSFDGASFEQFMQRYKRRYSDDEYPKRRALFYQNLADIAKMNLDHVGKASFQGNQFLDRSREEVVASKGGRRALPEGRPQNGHGSSSVVTPEDTLMRSQTPKDLPKNFDWRTHGAVPPVKDQGTCGSCWTFAAIASIESKNFLTNGQRMDKLSEQFLLDCTWSETNSACFGGSHDDAARIVLENYNGFIPLDKSYGAYLSADSYCKYVKGMEGVTISGWKTVRYELVPAHDDEALMRALLEHGVLATSLYVSPEVTFYRGGVISTENCRNIGYGETDHAVALVGFGTSEEGVPYWLLKNSWSNNWGDDGYFKVERGARDCGITLDSAYPIMARGGDNSFVFGEQRPLEFHQKLMERSKAHETALLV